MGRRSRQGDPADHNRRGKGKPTPPAPDQAAINGGTQEEVSIPPARVVGFVEGVIAQPGEHPAVQGPTLDLWWAMIPGIPVITRMPFGAWPAVRKEIDDLYEKLKEAGVEIPEDVTARASAAGIHLPGSTDVDREADAQRKMREGGDNGAKRPPAR